MSVVIESISKHDLKGLSVCVACSAGLDSTVLLEVLVQLGYTPKILHINYQLRGEDSEKDELFVRDLAKKYDLEIEVIHCPKEITKGKGINLQEAARNFRHAHFQQFIQENSANRVLLAHHQDDQIETFFLQLLRGSGIFGLGGMHSERNGIIRPFLNLRKEELLDFALENKLQWREDRSNQENKYKRNQFRNQIIPQLVESNPNLIESIRTIQEVFREEQQLIHLNLQERLQRWQKSFVISYDEWDHLTFEERIIVCNQFDWAYWMIERIQELKESKLSSKIDKSPVFRTKDGFSWNSNFEELTHWEFKIEEVEFLPDTFTKWEAYFDQSLSKNSLKKGFSSKTDFIYPIGISGKSNVHKLLKDKGIPEQWRSSYPVFWSGGQIVWIPGVVFSRNHVSTNTSRLKISISQGLTNL